MPVQKTIARDPASMLRGFRSPVVDDVESLSAHLAGTAGGTPLRRRFPDGQPSRIDLRRARLDCVELGILGSPRRMVVEAELDEGHAYLLQVQLAGQATMSLDSAVVRLRPWSGVVVSPPTRAQRDSGPGWVLSLALDRRLVNARLAARLGREPTRPLEFVPALGAATMDVCRYVLVIVDALDHGFVEPGSAVAATLEAGLVDLLLEFQPHTYGRSVADSEAMSAAARVRAVSAYVLDHLGEEIRLEHLVGAAQCGARALQTTFKRQCGMAPLEFVRRCRLREARGLLEGPGPAVTVEEVAFRTGFCHAGHLAAAYRRSFGESPAATLRRAQRRRRDVRAAV
ncbi:MAG: helix-turn-helix transcriptional regulator [Phycisphaerales bacterium]